MVAASGQVASAGDEAANEAVKPFSQNDAHGDVHVVDIEAGHLRVPSPPPSPPAKVHPEPRSKAGKTASAGPLGEFIFIVLKGSLSAVDQKGQAVQIGTDQAFSTPLSSALGHNGLLTVVSATAHGDCLLLRFALVDASEAALARKRAQEAELARAERALIAAKDELSVTLSKVHQLETRLGHRRRLRTVEDRRVVWKGALAKLRALRRFGLQPDVRSNPREDAAGLAEQLLAAKEALLDLQGEESVRERELKAIAATWQAMQPPIVAAEEAQFVASIDSVPPDDLSRAVLEEMASRVEGLKAFREQKRVEKIQLLNRLWDRLGVPEVARAQTLQGTTEPTHATFDKLRAEEDLMRAGLAKPMRAAQEQLRHAWSELRLEDDEDGDLDALRTLSKWDGRSLPTLDELASCELQAVKLSGYASVLAPFMSVANAEEQARMGGMLGRLLDFQATIDGQTADEMRAQADRKAEEAVALASQQREALEKRKLEEEERRQATLGASRTEQEEARKMRAKMKAMEQELEGVRGQLDQAEQASQGRALAHELSRREEALKADILGLTARAERERAETLAKAEREKAELVARAEREHVAALAQAEHERAELLAMARLEQEALQATARDERQELERQTEAIKVAMEEEKRQMLEQFGRERLQMAEEAEAIRRANVRKDLMQKSIFGAQADVLRDRKALEERQQAEIERQALEREGAGRREEFAQLNRLKAEALREVQSQLSMLLLPDRVVDAFNQKFAVVVPPPGSPPPAPEMLLKVQLQSDELKVLQEKLQTRCESDGLFVALRSLCTTNVWKPKDLAKQMTSGPSALKDCNGSGDGVITKEQLTHWLGAKCIKYTEPSLAFFLTAAGLGKPYGKAVHVIKFDSFVKAFETVKVHPVDLGDLPTASSVAPQSKTMGSLPAKKTISRAGTSSRSSSSLGGKLLEQGGKFFEQGGRLLEQGGKLLEQGEKFLEQGGQSIVYSLESASGVDLDHDGNVGLPGHHNGPK